MLSLDGCPRVFLDGGANDGDAVRAFLDRRFHGCAMSGPSRLYPKAWTSLDRHGKQAVMAPLGEPSSWCIRSFEANPTLSLQCWMQQRKQQRRRVYATCQGGTEVIRQPT